MADFDLDRSFLDHAPASSATPPRRDAETADSYDRPFLLTGGRTESDLPFETLVWTTGAPLRSPTPEEEHIVAAAAEPVAVAEIAATAGIPIGVARVLIDDLVRQGVLAVGEIAGHVDADDDLDFVQRIITGLKAAN